MAQGILRTAGVLLLALSSLLLAPPPKAVATSGQIIYTFAGGPDGANPMSDLVLDAAGNLYGTTQQGGASNCGTVFELIRTQSGWKHQILYSFRGTRSRVNVIPDGCLPEAGLVFDRAGNLYGTTAFGGASLEFCTEGSCGTVFKLTPNSKGGWSESVLYNFGGYTGDGQNPQSDLVFDSDGNLYGTTPSGGVELRICFYACGTVFRLTPKSDGSWAESVIYQFAGPPDGWDPSSPVVFDANGNLYGVTYEGGAATCYGYQGAVVGCGAVYELSPNSTSGGWTETVLYSFHHGQGTATFPASGLIIEKDGRIVSTSTLGGNGDGAFYELAPTNNGWQQRVLYRFYGNPDGATPVGQLAAGPGGALFGATSSGGASGLIGGTVFELEPAYPRWKERVLLSFDGTTTGSPHAGPVVDSRGHLYGTLTAYSIFGAIYEVVP